MKVDISTKRLEDVAAEALVVGLYTGETRLPERLARLDRAAQGQLSACSTPRSSEANRGR